MTKKNIADFLSKYTFTTWAFWYELSSKPITLYITEWYSDWKLQSLYPISATFHFLSLVRTTYRIKSICIVHDTSFINPNIYKGEQKFDNWTGKNSFVICLVYMDNTLSQYNTNCNV
jgi:hypothetical protein